jgi:DNA-binding response OmpR family regulator
VPGILLVEDDDDLREVMADALLADGHDVHAVGTAAAALDALAGGAFSLVLLDVGLGPGPDGVEICRRLRVTDAGVYVTMLTARDTEADIVMALEAGADDYVTKPVGIAELRSRVRAALRRADRPTDTDRDVLARGLLAVDASARSATAADQPLSLTMSEFGVLEALVRADGRVLSREKLIATIFEDDAYRDPRAIDVHVHHLRDKIGKAGGDAGQIVTVRGVGYRLDA